MRALLVTWDGAGNIPPELTLCGALVEAGHDVHVLTHDSLEERVRETGATFRPIRHAGQLDSRSPDEGPQDIVRQALVSDPLLSDLGDAIEDLAPDVVVADSMMLLVLATLAQCPIPSVAFHHTLADFLFGGFLDQVSMSMKADVDGILERRGLQPYDRPVQAVGENDLILTATYREFDRMNDRVPDELVHVGPLRGSGRRGRGPVARRLPDRPLVVVSLSTSHMDQLALLQRIADALGGAEVEGLVTTGPAVRPEALSLPANVAAVPFVAHEDVLPDARLLVTHAGHGTVMAGASSGTPMLCVPMGRDQPSVAERARELGLGHVCRPEADTPELEDAVARALADAGMADASRQFAARVRSHPGVEEAVARIESLTK